MRIGIDLDEIVADTMTAIINFHNETYKTSLKRDSFHSYYFWEIWGENKDKATEKMYEFYKTEHFSGISPVAGSLSAINKLKERGHDLFIVTGRQNEIIRQTEEWIEKYFPKVFSDIRFTNSYGLTGEQFLKSAICNQLNVKTMIEDDINNANDLAKSDIKVFLLDQPWNQGDAGKNIERVFSWTEIINKIPGKT